MLRLRTFGGLTLARGSEDLTGAVTQRRRLALLALLAVAGAAGVSRDKLLACLWPESDAERARHVLNQRLYAQRRVGGELFLGRNPPAEPRRDRDRRGRLRGGARLRRPATATEAYTGPFLDGFFMKDAPEFERWVEEQRVRLARRALDAMTGLAEASEAAGEPARAVHWWRRAGDIDRFDSRIALGLVEALAAAGDRPGALREAVRHEERLRADVAIEPDPAFRRAVVRIRDNPAPA